MRFSIDTAFVCKEWRNMGVASRLVDHALADLNVSPQDVAWLEPLESAGEALARRYAVRHGSAYRLKA